MIDAVLTWLCSYALHSTLLIGGLWLLERAGGLRRLGPRTQEGLWRLALFGGLISASVALLPHGLSWPSFHAADVTHGVAPVAVPEPAPAMVELPLVQDAAPAAAEPPDVSFGRLAHDLGLMLGGLWLVGAVWGLVELLLQWAWLRRTVRRLPALHSPRWQALCEQQAAAQGVAMPRLRQAHADWASPLLAPGRVLCLPAWSLELPDDEAAAVLGHELAHLRRRDPAWRLAAALLTALLWPQRLHQLALARLDLLAELACDASAAGAEDRRLALAQSLLRCAELRLGGRALPALACGAAASGSSLQARVRRLLQRDADTPHEPRALRWGLLAALAAALLALPAVVVSHTDARALLTRLHLGELADAWPPHWMGSFSGTRLLNRYPGGSLAVEIRGTASFNEAEDDLQTLDGRLMVRERQGDRLRELTLSAEGGAVTRHYQVDGQPAAWDADAQQWWANKAHQLSTQLTDPAVRAQRLFAKGGLDAVLADAEQPAEGHLRQRRIVAVLGLRQPLDARAQDRLIALAATLEGGFERREALSALAGLKLAETQQIAWLQAAAGMDGNFDRREALGTLAPQLLLKQPAVLKAWQGVLVRIDGDFDLRTALDVQIAATPDPAVLGLALEANRQLQGDFDKRAALSTVASHLAGDEGPLVQAYVQAAGHIQGNFDRREALSQLLERPRLGAAGIEQVLASAEGMDGSFERLQVLLRVVDKLADAKLASPALVERLRRAGRGLGDFERGQLENALDRLA